MNSRRNLELLYQHASKYQFPDFEAAFAQVLSGMPAAEDLADAYRMRAQIRLFAADASSLPDLEAAARLHDAPELPCLIRQWIPSGPNRFVVFPKVPHALEHFLQTLPQASALLGRWYAGDGSSMAQQMHSEILYYLGRFAEAIALAQAQYEASNNHPVDAIMAQYVLFRCYLATCMPAQAQESMLHMIRLCKSNQECLGAYTVVRAWANLTTGWSGDSPRFYYVPNGKALPVLEDRLAAIQKGISELSASEQPFAAYAAQAYEGAYTMRQYYMDVFHTMYWFHAGDNAQALAHFLCAYRVSADSGLVMPFVEYGKQLIPLIQYVQGSDISCSEEWLSEVLSLAEQYETGLEAFRA